ncbi:MAG: DUF1292 domain-containing protein [Bacilli bacterium]|nr:DUF1292 domain-containing protein [Bacilli bacterium]
MDNFIDITTEDGQKYKAEVIDIFNVDEYPDKDYIMYSFGENIGEDQERVYVSIIEDNDEECKLQGISDPREWSIVQDAIKKSSVEDEDDVDG